MPAPLCRYCGVEIKKLTRTVYLRNRPLQSHEQVMGEYSRYLIVDQLPMSIDECRKLTNHFVVSVKRNAAGDAISYFGEWDGASYVDSFFCNGDHAKKFGYAAARAGYATPDWNSAILKQEEEARK